MLNIYPEEKNFKRLPCYCETCHYYTYQHHRNGLKSYCKYYHRLISNQKARTTYSCMAKIRYRVIRFLEAMIPYNAQPKQGVLL